MDTGSEGLIDSLHDAVDERRHELAVLHLAVHGLLSEGPTDRFLVRLLAELPTAFLFPDQARARIRMGDRCIGEAHFPPDASVLAAEFVGPQGAAGRLEVASLLSTGDAAAAEFLPEESELLQSLARLLTASWRVADADREHADAEQRFRALFDNKLDCVKVLDAERQLVDMNPAGLQMLDQCKLAQVTGKSLDPFIHPDDLAEYLRLHERALAGETVRGRYRILARGGSTRFLETTNMPIRGHDGKTQVLSITTDLTRLVREEEKFRHLLDSSPDAMIITDSHGMIRIVNRACETTFGYSRYELAGKSVEMLLPESYRGAHVRHRENYQRKPHVRPMGMGKALKGRRKSGAEFPVEIALGPIHGDGETMFCATVRDLTGVREFEIALKEMADTLAMHTGQPYFDALAKYLSSHFGITTALVGVLDERGESIETIAMATSGTLDSNMSYALLGTPCAHVVRNRPRFHEKDAQLLYPKVGWFREVDAQGYAGVPLHDNDGNVVGLITAISRQALTNLPAIESFFKLSAARASAELDRLRQVEELRSSEERYSLVESGTADGVWDLNMRTRQVYYSPRVSELLGLRPGDLGDDPETFFARVHPDDVLAAREARHEHIQHGTPFDVQYRIRHANGTYRWFRTRGRMIRDEEGQPRRFLGNLTDITEGKRHQLQLKAENTWLEAFAAASPLAELLETIVESSASLLEGVSLAAWLLDRDSELKIFPEHLRAVLASRALRLLALEPETFSLDTKHAQWPWSRQTASPERMELRTVAVEGLPERVALAIAYPRNLPGQKHETQFLDAAERLVRLSLQQMRQGAELERQRLLFENLFQSAPEAMVILDRQDCVMDVNPHFTRLFQFSADEARGKALNDLIVPVEFSREAENLSTSAMNGRTVARESFRRRRDGSLVPVSILGAPVTVEGTEASYFAVYRDQSSLHEAAQKLDFQARHDQLTGLPNRYEFERNLQQIMSLSAEGQGSTGVLYIDLDQFKVINDTAGHSQGDRVLREITARLQPLVPAPHVFARLGGDEFAILIVNGSQGRCEQMANQVRERLASAPFTIDERMFNITASFGIVAVEAGSTLGPHEVLSLADSTCFLAKERGRNRVQAYDPTDLGVTQRREEMDWISRLNEALVDDRFELHFQKIVPVGQPYTDNHYEILLRMTDRDGNPVPPGVFIPPAERFNLMPRIDRWVLRNVFERLGRRGRENVAGSVVAINISGNTLSDDSLCEYVVSLFEQHDVAPASICFEITETAAIGNFDDALAFIAVARKLGCSVALDDFGSGLSSFRYLRQISPDYLKIDGSFVREIARSRTDYSMVEAINRVGKIMGVRTIAEFVEDAEILVALARIGVDYAQGYGVHRPESWSD